VRSYIQNPTRPTYPGRSEASPHSKVPEPDTAQNAQFTVMADAQPVEYAQAEFHSGYVQRSPPSTTVAENSIYHPRQVTELASSPVKKTWAEKHKRRGQKHFRKNPFEHRKELEYKRMGGEFMYVVKDEEGDVIMSNVE
jgi:hypothetical protein